MNGSDLLHQCAHCQTPKLLLIHTVKGWLCPLCFKALGEPRLRPRRVA